ncbi:HAMP domain-containing sensor histidine kinase [Novosphingobium sp.]|uniref:HAMP domain-containing sensor histidine kinase n=1 Tax=Novosphingobium sp. TaxID=1874826 RepID=UPI0026233AFF|nr:HAMP domain-containing sensor histidine kinase [Novosphingobium sp.]
MASAAYRVAFTYSAAFALAILLLGVAVYYAADADFRNQQDIGIAEETAGLQREFDEGGIADLAAAVAKREAMNPEDGYQYALVDKAGHRLAGTLAINEVRVGAQDLMLDDPSEGPDPARALVSALPDGSRLVVAIDSEGVERIDRTILTLFAAAFMLVIALGVIGALLLGGYLRQRLARISGTAQTIMAGDLAPRIPVGPRGDEFDQLAIALNAMLDRIGALLDNLRQVSTDVAHDLRTPLARLRSLIEGALDGSADPQTHRQALKRALAQSDDLLALFAAILRISEVEAGEIRRHFRPVDISDLAADLAESYAPAVLDGGRILTAEITPALAIMGDRELLAQAAINLLDNAQRHTPAGTAINMVVRAESDTILLAVADNGPGVAPGDHARIARRFARLEASRTTPGHGLGLNLVAAIAAAHGGQLKIEDNHPGLRVTLVLPKLAA